MIQIPEGDVTVFYRLIPTADSIRNAANQIVGNINKTLGGAGAGAGAGAAPGAAGAGGTMGAILGVLTTIGAAMFIVSAFFSAVGPIIKTFLKMFSAIVLILLAPLLKRIMPFMGQIFKMLINVSKWIAEGVEKLIKIFEDTFGAAMKGDPLAILTLLVGPMGVIATKGAKWLISTLSKVDWGALFSDTIANLRTAINDIGKSVFSEEQWAKIKSAIHFIENMFSVEGIWQNIESAVNFIGTEVFGKGLWESIKAAVGEIQTSLDEEWKSIIDSLADIGQKLKPIVDFFAEVTRNIGWTPSKAGGGLPNWLEELFNSLFTGSTTTGTPATDFISRPGMPVQSFSSDDTIVGTKGGMGPSVVNNIRIDAKVDRNELRQILSQFAREQGRELRRRTSYFGGMT